MDDDFIVEDRSGVSRKFVGGVGQLRPRVGHGVVGFGQVGLRLHRRVRHRVKEKSNAPEGDEFSSERNEFKRVALMVHAGHLRPRVVHRVVPEEAVG